MSARAAQWWWWMEQPSEPIDWTAVGRFVEVATKTASECEDIFGWMAAMAESYAEPEVDRESHEAAELLGVSLSAPVEEIRRACRKKIMAEGLHPDHGGDEERTRQVIAARDLLIAKVRS